MTTITLEKASPEYGQLRRAREGLKAEIAKLQAKALELQASGRQEPELREIGEKLRLATAELQFGYPEFQAAKFAAQTAAREQLANDKQYLRLVAEAAKAICNQYEPLAALAEVHLQARRQGVQVPAPIVQAFALEAAIVWLKEASRAGLLDVATLTPAIRKMAEEK